MKSNIKKLLFLIITIVLLFIGSIAYFFISNDAPVLHGKIIFHKKYKDNLRLDIYLPTKSVYKKSPVVIFIHGGAWITGRKEGINLNRLNIAINKLRANGYTIISPEYTLARKSKAPFPNCIMDAFDAVKWIEENADEYNIDIDNIGLMGESAGAHIAMMVAFSKGNGFLGKNNHKFKFNYVVDIYGPTELKSLYYSESIDTILTTLNKLPERLSNQLDISKYIFGFDPKTDSIKSNEYMLAYSPINYLDKDAPPTLIIHGKNDRIVPINQSNILKSKLDSLLIENEYYEIDNVDHAFFGIKKEQKKKIQHQIVEFIHKHYYHNNNL